MKQVNITAVGAVTREDGHVHCLCKEEDDAEITIVLPEELAVLLYTGITQAMEIVPPPPALPLDVAIQQKIAADANTV